MSEDDEDAMSLRCRAQFAFASVVSVLGSRAGDMLREYCAGLDRALPVLGALAADAGIEAADVVRRLSNAAADREIEPALAFALLIDLPPEREALRARLRDQYGAVMTVDVQVKAALLACDATGGTKN